MRKFLKKLCVVMMVMVMFAMCACSNSASSSKSSYRSENDRIESAVSSNLYGYILARYPDPKPSITYGISNNGNGNYGVAGKITLTDAAGYRCSGSYSCNVYYNETTDEYKVSNLNVSNFYRNSK